MWYSILWMQQCCGCNSAVHRGVDATVLFTEGSGQGLGKVS